MPSGWKAPADRNRTHRRLPGKPHRPGLHPWIRLAKTPELVGRDAFAVDAHLDDDGEPGGHGDLYEARGGTIEADGTVLASMWNQAVFKSWTV